MGDQLRYFSATPKLSSSTAFHVKDSKSGFSGKIQPRVDCEETGQGCDDGRGGLFCPFCPFCQ